MMKKTLASLMSVKPKVLLRNIKIDTVVTLAILMSVKPCEAQRASLKH